MGLRSSVLGGLARQLSHPRGIVGQWVGSILDRRNRDMVDATVQALDLVPGQSVVDVGFGGGRSLALLLASVGPTGRVYGAEISQTMLGRAQRRHRKAVADGRLVLAEASMTALPLPDRSVDALMTVNTVYFVPDLSGPFAEFSRVLTPGGRLVVGVYDPAGMERLPVTSHGFHVRPVAEISDSLGAAGMRLIDHQQVGSGPDSLHLLSAERSETSQA